MLKNTLKILQKDFFNSYKLYLIIIIFFLFLKIVSSYYYYFNYEFNIFNLSNVFGGYINSLYLDQDFKSCISDNQFTIFNNVKISCSYATRMPVLHYLYFIFTFVSKEYFFIAILKNILITLLFIYCLRIYYKNLLKKFKYILFNKFFSFNYFLYHHLQ